MKHASRGILVPSVLAAAIGLSPADVYAEHPSDHGPGPSAARPAAEASAVDTARMPFDGAMELTPTGPVTFCCHPSAPNTSP